MMEMPKDHKAKLTTLPRETKSDCTSHIPIIETTKTLGIAWIKQLKYSAERD